MKLHRLAEITTVVSTLTVGTTNAAPVIDGNIVGDNYGAAVSVQTVETAFGDNLSELNAAYATISDGKLFLALTGNLEANGNDLEIFIDSIPGGENFLSGFPGNDGTSVMAGLTFDTGFAADYHLFVQRHQTSPGTGQFNLDFSRLGTLAFSSYTDVFNDGSDPAGEGGIEGSGITGIGINASPIAVAFDNSNIAGIGGVGGGSGPAADQAAALAVTTGLELAIDLADIGFPTDSIKISVFINGQAHDFASNQFLGGLPENTGWLGGDGLGNFTGQVNFRLNDFAGDQFFTVVVPEPATLTLLGLCGLASLRRRR